MILEILSELMKVDESRGPMRPLLKPVKGFDNRLLETMRKMWYETPQARISVNRIKKDVFSVTHIRWEKLCFKLIWIRNNIGFLNSGKNLMDHVMNMLEKYASNLEGIVAERTEQLNEERQRADNLLYQILPKWNAWNFNLNVTQLQKTLL